MEYSCCLIAGISLPPHWPVEPDFWEEQEACYCSGDLQIAKSHRIPSLTLFGNVFFVDSDILVAPIDRI